jgi:hypothetical protein
MYGCESGNGAQTGAGATRLSAFGRGRGVIVAAKRLARDSLIGVVVLPCLSACLDAPPEYSVPTRIPPVIDADQVVPSTIQIHVVPDPSSLVQFNVPFRSEDAGSPLLAHFLLDYVADGQRSKVVGFVDVEPSDRPFFEQDGRGVVLPWLVNDGSDDVLLGCHSVTLILNYADNRVRDSLFLPFDSSLAAFQTWWFNIGDAEGDTRITDCPPGRGGF